LGTHRLVAHPGHPPVSVRAVVAELTVREAELRLRYRVEGSETLVLPPIAASGRVDELWRTTCFELFVRSAGAGGYAEFNFSPSARWAAYAFTGYREEMRELPLTAEPVCEPSRRGHTAVLDVLLPSRELAPGPWSVGLSAVIEEEGGVTSYWALAHPAGRPDFHSPACFALTLEPPPGP
jgi:hypothetical protein